MKNLLIFDLDGVITSEGAYWDAAGLVVHELIYSPQYWHLDERTQYQPVTSAAASRELSRATFPETEILAYKARAINSNWDTSYCAICLRFIDLLTLLPASSLAMLLPLRPWETDWLARLRIALAPLKPLDLASLFANCSRHLDAPVLQGVVGLTLINCFDAYASDRLGIPIESVFSRLSPFWLFCQSIFQEWYLGDELYTRSYQQLPQQPGKPGCLHFEHPLLPPHELRATLATLRQRGYTLGIATGRVAQEAIPPLRASELLSFFSTRHIATYNAVEKAEAFLRTHGDQTLLSKPHPFQFLYAADPAQAQDPLSLASTPLNAIVIGDATSDILGGKASGALTIAVLTGAHSAEARELLARSEPDFILDSVTDLPDLLEERDSLATIQRLQFSRLATAERLLRLWFARHLDLQPERVRLTPKAVSLNSFNGFYQQAGQEYFFKTHVEDQGILAEYYHAELLHQAGYPIVKPLRTLHEGGRQMVIYPVVSWPVIFDLVRASETGAEDALDLQTLISAERRECQLLLNRYRETLAPATAEEHASSPIHQLFWHRITGGRLDSFYRHATIPLPGPQNPGASLAFEDLLEYRWVINGVEQEQTLGYLLSDARRILQPARATPTIIGHGDAHYGNIFLEEQTRYLYFDPAFAGRHSPLLDLVKPLYHNVFATWIYFPHEIAHELVLTVTLCDRTLHLAHNYTLTPIRQEILQTKIEHLLNPLLAYLSELQMLPDDWLAQLRLALLCCPLLTINLLDVERLPTALAWLGLAQAVQLGNGGIEPWKEAER